MNKKNHFENRVIMNILDDLFGFTDANLVGLKLIRNLLVLQLELELGYTIRKDRIDKHTSAWRRNNDKS